MGRQAFVGSGLGTTRPEAVADACWSASACAVPRQARAVLPGGVRKLLDIAMALVVKPKILLLDEPTSGVSADEKFAIMDLVMGASAPRARCSSSSTTWRWCAATPSACWRSTTGASSPTATRARCSPTPRSAASWSASRRRTRRPGPVLKLENARRLDPVGADPARRVAHARAGQLIGLIGRNGAGKTTLMRTIMGILPPTAGAITFEARSCGGPLVPARPRRHRLHARGPAHHPAALHRGERQPPGLGGGPRRPGRAAPAQSTS